MVMYFRIYDNVQGYRQLLNSVLTNGDPVSPRGQTCLEMRNVTIEMPVPIDVLATGCGRNFNTRLAAYESLSLIAGVSMPGKATRIAPNLAQFLNEYGDFDGAYGPRLADQLPYVISKLAEDKDSRQACAVLWRHDELHAPTLDLPCTVYLNFSIRDDALTLTTHMRSQDAWWGWPYDLVQFTQLQWTAANVLGVRVGPYVHMLDSLHVYSRNAEEIYRFLRHEHGDKAREFLTGIGNGEKMSWGDAQYRALSMLDRLHGDPVDVAMDDPDYWFIRQGLRDV